MQTRDYLRNARRRWILIVACVVIAVGATAFFTFRATPLYASDSQLFISAPGADPSRVSQGTWFSQERLTSYADMAANNRVAANVIRRVGGGDLSPDEMSAKVSARAIPQTLLLQISVSDPKPRRAQAYAQAYAQVMRRFITSLERPATGDPSPIRATVSENASLPTSPYSPQPVRNLGLAALLGLLLGFGVAVLRELLDTTVKSAEDITALTATPVIGTISWDPDVTRKPLITDIASHAPRAEAFRVLRTNLQFVDVDKPSKVITITSAIPEEGKTSTATNLALALAQAGERTLLIEGDLRRPRVDSKLGMEHAVGLTTLLVGRVDLTDAIQKHGPSGLDVITSGSIPPNPAELLQSQAMNDLLKSLRRQYHTIIIDAPPLLPVTDAVLLSAKSDGAMIVVRYGRTTRDQLINSMERLAKVDARAIGIVINRVPARGRGSGSYGYGYGYDDGYAPNSATIRARRQRKMQTT